MPRVSIGVEDDTNMVTHTTQEHRRSASPNRSSDGFTLIELMMVVTIIGILATIALMGFAAPLDRVRRVSCLSNQHAFEGGITTYKIANGYEPEDIDDLRPYVRGDFAMTCPSDSSVKLVLDPNESAVTCPNHPR